MLVNLLLKHEKILGCANKKELVQTKIEHNHCLNAVQVRNSHLFLYTRRAKPYEYDDDDDGDGNTITQ